jgi:hypothetical protein
MASNETFSVLKGQYVCTDFINSKWSVVRSLSTDNPADCLKLVIHPANPSDEDTIFCFPNQPPAPGEAKKRVAFCVTHGVLTTLILVVMRNGNLTLFQIPSSGFDEELSCPARTNRLTALEDLKRQAVAGQKSNEHLMASYVNSAWEFKIENPFWRSRRPATIATVADELGYGEMEVMQPTVCFFSAKT